MSASLLDVNVLIALLERRHVHHEQAHRWFAGSPELPWATCPLTQNAVLRILGHPRYPNSPGPPAVVAPLIGELVRHARHRFWPDAISLLEQPAVDTSRLLQAAALTDTYLLALAVHHGGRLVTLDRQLNWEPVTGGREALLVIDA